jgi:hypothetical protein
VPELPRYDHDKLGDIFHDVANWIRIILASIQFNDYLRENFVWHGDIMRADLSSAWFDDGVDWYLGVDRADAAGMSDAECRRLLSAANDFIWKFGGNDQNIHDIAAIGLTLQDVDEVRTLPPENYSFWRVLLDPPHVKRAVSENFSVAAHLRDKKLPAMHAAKFVGTSRFSVTRPNGDEFEFQLALFGVRRKKPSRAN